MEDVKVEPSTTEEVVNTAETTTQEVEGQEQETSTQEVKTEVQPDRPEINYAMEAARKASEALEIARQLQQQQQSVQQPPQYTKAQLQAYIADNPPTDQRVWALNEIDKIETTQRQSEMREMFNGYQKRTTEEQIKQQTFQSVINQFPQLAIRDNNGQFLGFNTQDPLYQRVDQYMRDPDLVKHPRGMEVAVKMAAFDLGVKVNQNLQRKVTQTTAQLRKEQKKTLIGGGGVNPQEATSSKVTKLAEEYKKTGNIKIFKELVKLRGLIPE